MNNETKDEVVQLYLDDIIPNRFQPREVFDEKALKELAVSIKEHGVIQPIIVRSVNGKYEIIAGERRYKASALAGLTKIPAIIRDLDDKESSKVALLENLQRKNLNPIEEARTYQKILEIDQMTQEELAKTMGKSQSAVANKLRLLSLPDEVQDALLKEQVSERHARALLNVPDSKKQSELLKKIINSKMTVRALEDEINKLYPKNDNNSEEEPEGNQYVQIPSISSTVNSTPLMPTTEMPQENSDYGKVTIAPPIGGKIPNMENIDNIVNYGEIDKDKLEQQNNSNTRTDYYTTTSVSPVDVQTIQANAFDIGPSRTEPVADLDNLLNINNQIRPNNYFANQQKEEKYATKSEFSSNNDGMFQNRETEEYFKVPDLKDTELPQIKIPVENSSITTSAATSENGVLSIQNTSSPVIDSTLAINKLKELVRELESQGIKIAIDEMDFGKTYQAIIKIDK